MKMAKIQFDLTPKNVFFGLHQQTMQCFSFLEPRTTGGLSIFATSLLDTGHNLLISVHRELKSIFIALHHTVLQYFVNTELLAAFYLICHDRKSMK